MARSILSSLGSWHFGFHSQVELATAMVTGRERAYSDHFFETASVDSSLITADDRDFYAAAAQQPGALAAGFKTYAVATTMDGAENEETLAREGKLTVPVLGIGGSASLGPYMAPMLAEVATDTRTVTGDAGHFLGEEAPLDVARAVRDFVAEHADPS